MSTKNKNISDKEVIDEFFLTTKKVVLELTEFQLCVLDVIMSRGYKSYDKNIECNEYNNGLILYNKINKQLRNQ